MEFVCGLFPVVEEAEDLSECLGFFSAKVVKLSSLVLELIIIIINRSNSSDFPGC